jgi:hypothetical protein
MNIRLDLETVPPTVTLENEDDFADLRITARRVDDTRISRETLERLAGARAADAEWHGQLDAMITYAESHGWIATDGTIRAHIEWT